MIYFINQPSEKVYVAEMLFHYMKRNKQTAYKLSYNIIKNGVSLGFKVEINGEYNEDAFFKCELAYLENIEEILREIDAALYMIYFKCLTYDLFQK